ncbi:MAG: hypothetical protein ACJ8C4_10840 [Gemmataceae bacterium]
MSSPASPTPSTSDWLETGHDAPMDAERIALKTSAPATPTSDAADKKAADARRLAQLENELIDLRKPAEAKKPLTTSARLEAMGINPAAFAKEMPSSAAPASNPAPVKPDATKKPAPTKEVAAPVEAAKPAVIRDLDAAKYPTRLMGPETAIMGAAGYAWVVYAMPYLPANFQTLEIYASVPGAMFLFQLVRFCFRTLGGGYRVTKTQLLRTNPGPIRNPAPIQLHQISGIKVEQTTWQWLMFAGCLRLSFDRNVHPALLLGPVNLPRRRARLLQQAIDGTREGQVFAARVAV